MALFHTTLDSQSHFHGILTMSCFIVFCNADIIISETIEKLLYTNLSTTKSAFALSRYEMDDTKTEFRTQSQKSFSARMAWKFPQVGFVGIRLVALNEPVALNADETVNKIGSKVIDRVIPAKMNFAIVATRF